MARDRSGHTLDFVTGNGQLTKTRLSEALGPVLATDALPVSDSNPTYRAFCRTEGISHEAVNPGQGQRVKGAYHVQNVNAYHSRFKLWLDRFHGVATDVCRTISAGGGSLNSTITQHRNGCPMPPWGIFNN